MGREAGQLVYVRRGIRVLEVFIIRCENRRLELDGTQALGYLVNGGNSPPTDAWFARLGQIYETMEDALRALTEDAPTTLPHNDTNKANKPNKVHKTRSTSEQQIRGSPYHGKK